MNPPDTLAEIDLCGIDGKEENPVLHGEINMFIRRALIHHIRPVKNDLRATKKCQETMQNDYAAIKNQIKGAKWALVSIAGILAFMVPLIIKMITAVELISK